MDRSGRNASAVVGWQAHPVRQDVLNSLVDALNDSPALFAKLIPSASIQLDRSNSNAVKAGSLPGEESSPYSTGAASAFQGGRERDMIPMVTQNQRKGPKMSRRCGQRGSVEKKAIGGTCDSGWIRQRGAFTSRNRSVEQLERGSEQNQKRRAWLRSGLPSKESIPNST